MPHREWKVEKAPSKEQLEVVLNGMTRAGWEVFTIVTEGSDDAYDFTIVLYRGMVETRALGIESA